MKAPLLFNFSADKEKHTLSLQREFAASRSQVWKAFTQSDILDQWFAPKTLKAKTKHMDFSEGGYWLYAMIEPEGKVHWSRFDYLHIHAKERFTARDSFCDEEGRINTELPQAEWALDFQDFGPHCLLDILIRYDSAEDLETVLRMGMQEGMDSILRRLDEYFLQQPSI